MRPCTVLISLTASYHHHYSYEVPLCRLRSMIGLVSEVVDHFEAGAISGGVATLLADGATGHQAGRAVAEEDGARTGPSSMACTMTGPGSLILTLPSWSGGGPAQPPS